ncbi:MULTISPECIES: GH1 family beta-glucosidase [unclassified Rathayibacter]|uniref:GH1 family beta-glucosidase n=1 Tax=unclassified Rathayibacter TaxID=2609250 RepID=UPI001C614D84|nr:MULTISPECIES: GH1 family beta-glucosidase [unclassified Rathayibacter]
MMSPPTSHLPDDFVWGLATSAYQIEGGVRQDGRTASIWDTFAHTPGRTRHGDTGDTACDHRRLWEADLDLLVELGVPAYRLSLSWTRLQPGGRGPLNPAGVRWYRELLSGLHARGIRPFVTLYHWDLPQELEDEGGWTARSTARAFAEYAGAVAAALGDLTGDWITINEPWCAAFLGYGLGVHAPGRSSTRDAVTAAHHLNLAHGLATRSIRTAAPGARIGVTNIVADLVPATPDDLDAVERLDAVNHQLFLAPVYRGEYTPRTRALLDPWGLSDAVLPGDLAIIAEPTDFVGINHYQRVVVEDDADGGAARVRETPAGSEHTSFGWSVTPEALTAVLLRVTSRYSDLPVYITENGASFHDYVDPEGRVLDPERIDYLAGYIGAIDAAAAQGVTAAGYFAWSFLDNFEWGEGYDKRFGLVHVDFGTQKRTPKQSASFYRDVIAAHRSSAAAPAAALTR